MEIGVHQCSREGTVTATYFERRQTGHLVADFAEEVRMIVTQWTAGVMEFISPYSVAQIHASDQANPSEV